MDIGSAIVDAVKDFVMKDTEEEKKRKEEEKRKKQEQKEEEKKKKEEEKEERKRQKEEEKKRKAEEWERNRKDYVEKEKEKIKKVVKTAIDLNPVAAPFKMAAAATKAAGGALEKKAPIMGAVVKGIGGVEDAMTSLPENAANAAIDKGVEKMEKKRSRTALESVLENPKENYFNTDMTAKQLAEKMKEAGLTYAEAETTADSIYEGRDTATIKAALKSAYGKAGGETAAPRPSATPITTGTGGVQTQKQAAADTLQNVKQNMGEAAANAVMGASADIAAEIQSNLDNRDEFQKRLQKTMDKWGLTFKDENTPVTIFQAFKNGRIPKQSIGYYILDSIGTALSNASAVIKGGEQKPSALKQRQEKMLDAYLQRESKKQDEIMENGIEAAKNIQNLDNKIYEGFVSVLADKSIQRPLALFSQRTQQIIMQNAMKYANENFTPESGEDIGEYMRTILATFIMNAMQDPNALPNAVKGVTGAVGGVAKAAAGM